MPEFDREHDPDLSEGLKTMENLVAVLSPPPKCGWCGKELKGSAKVDLRFDEDGFCDSICRSDYRESCA